MHIELRLDPSRLRRGHRDLAARLARDAGCRLTLSLGGSRAPLPSSVDLLMSLERLIYRLPVPRASDRISVDALALSAAAPTDHPDLLIDFSEPGQCPLPARVLRPLFDGVADEAALVGALLAGRMPTIEIEDVKAGPVLARGAPSSDNAGSLCEAYDNVLARLATLIVATVRGKAPMMPPLASRTDPVSGAKAGAFAARGLAFAAIRRLYHLCCYAPHWRVYWRFVEDGDLWDARTLTGSRWNILPDAGFRCYADPFPFTYDGRTFLFAEDFDHRSQKGIISVVEFDERGPAGRARAVLEEPWHLSYPFLIEHDGQVWMIPESSGNRTVALYRGDPFPDRWVKEATLLSDIEASDATVIRHDGRLWMFAATRDGAGSWSDTLSLFSAPDLRGPWTAHADNPVLIDQAGARPAGYVISRHGRLWRPVQDCTNGYGTGIGLAEILRLDGGGFAQKVHAVLRADPTWPGRRMHTLNRSGRLECLDGAAHSPRSRLLAGYLNR